MKKIVLVGAGGHCRSCIEVLKSTYKYTVIGIVNKSNQTIIEMNGIPIIGTDDDLEVIVKKFKYFLVTIGQIKPSNKRKIIFNKLKRLNAILEPIYASTSYVSTSSKVLSGTIIMHQAIVNTNSNIGENSIINTQAIIEHDCKIGNNCHISTGAKLNGGVIVGDNTFIGSGSIVFQGVEIGSNSVISAGSIIRKNVGSRKVVRSYYYE
jgi:sugar O-acyltransferase (sialic acid O-acetyltransferase NeuD family)